MIDAPLAFAFAAGLVATINPCGFAMLPAYLSYFVGLDDAAPEGSDAGGGVARALVIGLVVSAGFFVVFGIVGALVTVGLRSVIDFIPWAAVLIGVLLVGLGVAMLFFRYEPTVALPKLGRGTSSRRYSSVFVFGISYAIASLSCGLPVFLAVIGTATATGTNFLSGFVTFLAYGAGMSMLLIVLTLALAIAKQGLVTRLRRAMRYVGRVSGAVLIIAGAYITAFWIVNLNDPLGARNQGFQFLERFQTTIATQLGERPVFWALVFAAVITVAVGYTVRRRLAAARSDDRAPEDDRPIDDRELV